MAGTHEAEVSFGDEADLHKHKTNCTKNPGHKNFIPISDFRLSHLPYLYRTTKVYDLVKSLSQLTVRIAVDFTSQERIDFYPDTTDPYPFSEYKGLNFLRTGTGRVMEAVVVTGSEDDYCPCGDCRDSDTPSEKWAVFRILTSAHVVYDDEEARHTKCRIDYHNDTDPKITINGYSCSSDFESDKCKLTCVSHDLSLVEKLNKSLQMFESLCEEVHEKYNNSNGFQTFIAVVSHPHGCPMQVSLGKLTHRFEFVGDYYTAFTYNTSTCPGSSGAPVFIMARDVGWWAWTFCHRGGNSHGNHCGSTWEA